MVELIFETAPRALWAGPMIWGKSTRFGSAALVGLLSGLLAPIEPAVFGAELRCASAAWGYPSREVLVNPKKTVPQFRMVTGRRKRFRTHVTSLPIQHPALKIVPAVFPPICKNVWSRWKQLAN